MSSLLIIGPLLFCLNDAYLRMIKQYDKLFEAIKIINVISFIKKKCKFIRSKRMNYRKYEKYRQLFPSCKCKLRECQMYRVVARHS